MMALIGLAAVDMHRTLACACAFLAALFGAVLLRNFCKTRPGLKLDAVHR